MMNENSKCVTRLCDVLAEVVSYFAGEYPRSLAPLPVCVVLSDGREWVEDYEDCLRVLSGISESDLSRTEALNQEAAFRDLRDQLEEKLVDWLDSCADMTSVMFRRYLSGPTRSSLVMLRHEGVSSFNPGHDVISHIGKLMHETTRCQIDLSVRLNGL
jgi:hypothetical protein